MSIMSTEEFVKTPRYSPSRIPTAISDEKNIGKVVKVQVFRRDSEETIDVESLAKYIGVLEAACFDSRSITISIKGLAPIQVSRRRQLVEVYI